MIDDRTIADVAAKVEYEIGDLEALSVSTAAQTFGERQARRTERAIRGAIRAGYDGVDINRPPMVSQNFGDGNFPEMGIQSIVPWSYPAPDGDNGYRTERYTWDWFSDAELTAILQADDATLREELGVADD